MLSSLIPSWTGFNYGPSFGKDTKLFLLAIIPFEVDEEGNVTGYWNIPKVATSQFYKSSSWSPFTAFKTDYHVKIIEQVYGINKEYETLVSMDH